MSKPDLVPLYDATCDGVQLLLEIDRHTNELYFNKKRVITDISLNKTEKKLASIVAISTAVIAFCSIITLIIPILHSNLNHGI